MLGDLAHELLARPGEIPKLLDRRRRNEAAADQAMGQEIRDPRGVVHVALAARDVADVGGVSEHQGKAPLEHVPDRLPIHARRLHRDVRAAVLREPIAQLLQPLGRRLERLDVLSHALLRDQSGARDHRLLVYVQPCATRIQNLHRLLLWPVEVPAWDPHGSDSRERAPGRRPPTLATICAARRIPGPTS